MRSKCPTTERGPYSRNDSMTALSPKPPAARMTVPKSWEYEYTVGSSTSKVVSFPTDWICVNLFPQLGSSQSLPCSFHCLEGPGQSSQSQGLPEAILSYFPTCLRLFPEGWKVSFLEEDVIQHLRSVEYGTWAAHLHQHWSCYLGNSPLNTLASEFLDLLISN